MNHSKLLLVAVTLVSSLAFSAIAFAGVTAYTGTSGEKLYIEAAPKISKDAFLVKFEGPESKWAGKVIQAKKEKGRTEVYSFEYDLELSSGVQKRQYQIVVAGGSTLKNGSIAKQVELYFPEGEKDGLKLTYDETLTNSSQSIGLADAHKKKPFKPEVD